MSISVRVFVEVLLDNQWENICLYNAKQEMMPVIDGQSSLYLAIRDYTEMIKEEDEDNDSFKLYNANNCEIRVIDGYNLERMNLATKQRYEYCAYVDKIEAEMFDNGVIDELYPTCLFDELDFAKTNEILSQLKSYTYKEWTNPGSTLEWQKRLFSNFDYIISQSEMYFEYLNGELEYRFVVVVN